MTIYNIGAGARLIAALILLVMVVAIFLLASKNWREFEDLPRYALHNPVGGAVFVLGAALTLWCLWIGIWFPLSALLISKKVTGNFSGFAIGEEPRGVRCISIVVEQLTLKTRYNSVLEKALRSLSPGDRVTILRGARGTVTEIRRAGV